MEKILVLLLCLLVARKSTGHDASWCRDHPHFTIADKTCCKGHLYNTRFPVLEFWNECDVASDNAEESYYTSTMRVYGCVIHKAIGEDKSLSLFSFAEMVTENYPETVKVEILKAIIEKTKLIEDLEGLERLKKVRDVYYDIESNVCSGENHNYISAEVCHDQVQWENARGACCGNISIPMIINRGVHGNLASKEQMDDIGRCTRNLITSLGTPSDIKELDTLLYGKLFTTCDLLENKVIPESEIFSFPNLPSLIKRRLPNHVSQSVVDAVTEKIANGLGKTPDSTNYPIGEKVFRFLEHIFNTQVKKYFTQLNDKEKARKLYIYAEINYYLTSKLIEALTEVCAKG